MKTPEQFQLIPEQNMPFNLAGQTYKEWAQSLPDEPEDGPEPQENMTWVTADDLCSKYSNE